MGSSWVLARVVSRRPFVSAGCDLESQGGAARRMLDFYSTAERLLGSMDKRKICYRAALCLTAIAQRSRCGPLHNWWRTASFEQLE